MAEIAHTAVCSLSPDNEHFWVRRRDGKACMYCGDRQFGSSDLTPDERKRIQDYRDTNG